MFAKSNYAPAIRNNNAQLCDIHKQPWIAEQIKIDFQKVFEKLYSGEDLKCKNMWRIPGLGVGGGCGTRMKKRNSELHK